MARKNLGKILPEYRHGKLVKRANMATPKPHKLSRRNDDYLAQLATKHHGTTNQATPNFRLDELENYLLEQPNAQKSFPFADQQTLGPAVFKNANGKMFALVREDSSPLKLSLKCDPELSRTLRERYESVQPGYHLNKRHWNTILLTGQLSDDEIRDLIRLSFALALAEK